MDTKIKGFIQVTGRETKIPIAISVSQITVITPNSKDKDCSTINYAGGEQIHVKESMGSVLRLIFESLQ